MGYVTRTCPKCGQVIYGFLEEDQSNFKRLFCTRCGYYCHEEVDENDNSNVQSILSSPVGGGNDR